MNLFEAINACFNKYAQFSGRARRSEYWYWQVSEWIMGLVVYYLYDDNATISAVIEIILFLPGLAVSVRRLHDIGRSGWALLWILFPVIGWILLFIYYCTDGHEGPNAYGDDPKGRGMPYGTRLSGSGQFQTSGSGQSSSTSFFFCSNCGSAVSSSDRFCPHCGKPVVR